MTKAILLSLPRSGTEFLKECLHYHIDIVCGGEILGRSYQSNFKSVIPDILKFYRGKDKKEVAMFKCMYQHLDGLYGSDHDLFFCPESGYVSNIGLSGLGMKYIKEKKVKVIHFVRDDYLRRALSKEFHDRERETGRKPHTTKIEEKYKMKVRIDYVKCHYLFGKKNVKIMKNYLKELEINHIEIRYSDIVGREGRSTDRLPDNLAWKICNFLKVEYQELKSPLKKQNPYRIEDYVLNHKELMNEYAKWK